MQAEECCAGSFNQLPHVVSLAAMRVCRAQTAAREKQQRQLRMKQRSHGRPKRKEEKNNWGIREACSVRYLRTKEEWAKVKWDVVSCCVLVETSHGDADGARAPTRVSSVKVQKAIARSKRLRMQVCVSHD